MKEWLKQFTTAFIIDWWLTTDDLTKEQFITDYLRDNPLPLPTDEEAGEAAINLTDGLSPFESFMAGVELCREKMEGKV